MSVHFPKAFTEAKKKKKNPNYEWHHPIGWGPRLDHCALLAMLLWI